MGWNYLSIPKLQRLHRWSLGMDKYFHLTLYRACDYLCMLGLKLNHVSKRGHCLSSCQTFVLESRVIKFKPVNHYKPNYVCSEYALSEELIVYLKNSAQNYKSWVVSGSMRSYKSEWQISREVFQSLSLSGELVVKSAELLSLSGEIAVRCSKFYV